MKRILTYAILALGLVGCAMTPDKAPDGTNIPLHVNTIIIKSKDEPAAAFRKIKKMLIVKGFTLKSTDKDTLTINTNFKNFDIKGNLNDAIVALNVAVLQEDNESLIYIRGDHNLVLRSVRDVAMKSDNISPVEHYGMKGSPMKTSWDVMYSFAKSINHTKLTFKKD